MKEIKIKAFAKINLSLDVGPRGEDDMHPVDTVMQQVDLYDIVTVEVGPASEPDRSEAASVANTVTAAGATPIGNVAPAVDTVPERETAPGPSPVDISITCSDSSLPSGKDNLAYKAAILMAEKYESYIPAGTECIKIHLEKHIPVAAGLAGGSSNAAAVILALNELWGLNLAVEELLANGAKLGSDIPFCISGQICGNSKMLSQKIRGAQQVSTCARGAGTGAELSAVKPLTGAVLLAKPDIALLTAQVYSGFDKCTVEKRPDNDRMCLALEKGDRDAVKEEMINLLELYSLRAAPEVAELKEATKNMVPLPEKVLMSGSGPTVYALFPDIESATAAAEVLMPLLPTNYFIHPASLLG